MNSFVEFDCFKLILIVPFVILHILWLVFGIPGNLLIMGSVLSNKDLRSVTGGIIFNIAVADLVTTCVSSFPLIGIYGGKETYEKFPWLCYAAASSCFVFCTVSFLNMSLLAFNRYIYICHEDMYKKIFSKRLTITYLLATWLVGLASDAPNFLTKNGQHYEEKLFTCMCNQHEHEAYIAFVIITITLVLGLLAPYFYLKIFQKVKLAKCKAISYNLYKNNQAEFIEKTTKGIYYSFLLFSCSFVPFLILLFFKNLFQNYLTNFIFSYGYFLARSNSVFNPILYGSTNSHFKKSFGQFYTYLSCKKPTVNKTSLPECV